MSLRQEFLFLANQLGSNFSQLCQRFEISRKTGYKWLQRYQQTGAAGLADRSRRPQHSPRRTEAAIEQQVLAIRDQYGWGARKIKWCLEREGTRGAGQEYRALDLAATWAGDSAA